VKNQLGGGLLSGGPPSVPATTTVWT